MARQGTCKRSTGFARNAREERVATEQLNRQHESKRRFTTQRESRSERSTTTDRQQRESDITTQLNGNVKIGIELASCATGNTAQHVRATKDGQ